MISMKVIKKDVDNMRNQFVIEADEPVTIEFAETDYEHTVAHIYRGTDIDEYEEPVGAYDSAVRPTDWKVE